MSTRAPSIAERPDSGDIDAALDAGTSLRSIALSFGISKTTLIRYRDNRHALPSTAPTIRVRSRIQPEAAPPEDVHETMTAQPCAGEQHDNLPPTEAKLREVAKLLAQGLSREEIAARYRVSPGTVTDWHRKIKANEIALVHSVTAENIVATLLANGEKRSAALWRIASRCEITAPRAAIAAIDGLRKEDQHVAAMADSLGLLNRFPAPREHDDPESLPNLFRDIVAKATAISGEAWDAEEDDPPLDFASIAERGEDRHDR